MGSCIEEAHRAKAIAEKQFIDGDIMAANNYALRAQKLCPELEGISQMVATFGVYAASVAKINGEIDFYSILGMDPSTEKPKLKKRYKKMAILLHPDKNKTIGADGAFRLVSEAWALLSDNVKRSSYDQSRNLFFGYGAGAGGYDCSKYPPSISRLDSFWTVCTSCHVQYEYLRKYVNKRLTCKNCRGVFIAIETGLATANGAFQYSAYTYTPENGYGSHGCVATFPPTNTGCCTPNGVLGHHTGYKSEYASNISFRSNSCGNAVGVMDHNASSTSCVLHQSNGDKIKTKANGKHHTPKAASKMGSNGYTGCSEASRSKRGRPAKKRKLDEGITFTSEQERSSASVAVEAKTAHGNGNLKSASKISTTSEVSARRCSATSSFDVRQMLIDKARSVILRKLEEMRLASEAAAALNSAKKAEADKCNDTARVNGSIDNSHQPELKRSVSMIITVPDSDFHDFDQDRLEVCFKPKQIWALYDEEDGMPRLYCIIREVISLNPFKIHISYLNSRSDCEFGSVNWLDSGFTKSCGSFRVFYSEMVEQVNIFSHLLRREKAGRGGCVRIYPRGGDIWAVYRNWSPDWNRTTPHSERHQYEMVEVIEDYSEDHGVWVTPLVKLDGFKTVYQRNTNSNAARWIPRREMLRFSHQVPSCSLKVDGTNLPEGCWDLDPAATPDELLQAETEIRNNSTSGLGKATETPDDHHAAALHGQFAEKTDQRENSLSITGPGNCI
ncbi:hypothetical protein F511_05458 [Dorcoceras hygrometricum]|uniref:J domain-containing protein n=1 Tax=Dorcoceras hygrometricum TaxID=472368 RepID=A0A2Z7B9X5_9LAMI|nr:hypothetical protein F511_05458 [Dorcoceras hygrometricum]